MIWLVGTGWQPNRSDCSIQPETRLPGGRMMALSAGTRLALVQNWFEELKRLVPKD